MRAGAAMMLCGPRSTTPRLSAYFALLFSTCLPILDLVDGTIGLGRVLGFLWNDCMINLHKSELILQEWNAMLPAQIARRSA